jgi:hypothetical protein
VIETLAGKPVLAWTVHESHCWFYSTPQVRRALQQRRLGEATKLKKNAAAQLDTPRGRVGAMGR